MFREATWEEALDLAASKLKGLRDTHGLKALAGFGSAKGSNEEAYLFQKLVRTGFGSNNVDHCTRLCHASSVAALLEGVGSAAVSNQVNDIEHSDLILVIGSNPTANHPVAATWMKNAAKKGTKIVLADPRITDIGRYAWRTLQFRADTDVALLNALIHTVIDEGLVNEEFVRDPRQQFRGAEEERAGLQRGGHGADLRHPRGDHPRGGARIRQGQGRDDPVGHGHQPARARHRQRPAASSRWSASPARSASPAADSIQLRGQNNVQGASDAGLIPMMLPNYSNT